MKNRRSAWLAVLLGVSALASGCGVRFENLCRYKGACLTNEAKPTTGEPFYFKAESVAIHSSEDLGSEEFSLPIDDRFVEPRNRFFVRLTLPRALQPASVADANVTLRTEQGSFSPFYYRVSGNQLDIEAGQFGTVGGTEVLHKRICLTFEGLADLEGNPLPKFGFRFSRIPGDATGDGVVNLGDYYQLAENQGALLADASELEATAVPSGLIRSDLDLDRRVWGEDGSRVLNSYGSKLSQSEPFPAECMSAKTN